MEPADRTTATGPTGHTNPTETIVHHIRLHPGVPADRFESWVRDVDYATCPELPSVLAFDVHRLSPDPPADADPDADPDAPVHYIEVIRVTGADAFARDMTTPAFRRLVGDFERMASVVRELTGTHLAPGYRAA